MTKHKGHFHEEAVYIQKLGYFQLGHNEDTGVKFSVSIISEETNQPWNMIPLPFHQQISGFFGFSFKKKQNQNKKTFFAHPRTIWINLRRPLCFMGQDSTHYNHPWPILFHLFIKDYADTENTMSTTYIHLRRFTSDLVYSDLRDYKLISSLECIRHILQEHSLV